MRKSLSIHLAAGAAIAALALSACAGNPTPAGSEDSDAPTKMTMAVYPGSFLSLKEYVGVEAGIYLEYGIEAELIDVPTGPAQIAAVASRSVDVAINSPGNTLMANAEGQDIVYLNNFHNRLYYTWISQKDLDLPNLEKGFPESFAGLKGMTIGISARGSEVEMLTRILLEEAGLDPERDVTWVAAGFGQTGISAFQSGQVDIIVGMEPMNTMLLDVLDAGDVLLETRTGDDGPELFEGFPGTGAVTLRATADSNKDLFQRFVDAQSEILDYMTDVANLDEVAAIYANYSGLDLDVAKKIVDANRTSISVQYDCNGHKKVVEYLERVDLFTASQAQQFGSCGTFVWDGVHDKISLNL